MSTNEIAKIAKGGGNTKTPPLKVEIMKKRSKWCFTINNYTPEELLKLLSYFNTSAKKFIVGKEIGESGTPHLQAYCNLKVQRSFSAMKKSFPKAHIEAANGTDKENFMYCSKDGDFESNMKFIIPKKIKDPLEGKTLYKYQEQVLEIVKNGDDDRTINWFWEPKGNTGKSALCKHICLNYNCMILNGKQNDMFNAILQYQDKLGAFPEIIIIDIPRSMSDYVSWGGIEKIKDGCFYSGKYEGGMCVFNCPTIICFANVLPDINKLSTDRWNIVDIHIGVDFESLSDGLSSYEESASQRILQ